MDAPPTTTTKQILAELQPFQRAYCFTVTDSLANCQGPGVQLKLTDTLRKAQMRKIQRECRDNITEQLGCTYCTEGQSLVSQINAHVAVFRNTRTRECASSLSQHKIHKHSPKFDNVHWDKEGLFKKLKNWPNGSIINWSEIAKEFNIPGLNGGQTVK